MTILAHLLTVGALIGLNLAADAHGQSACRVLVASSAEILHKDQGDLWDSGPREFSTIEGVVPGDDVPLVVTMPNGSVDRVTIAIRKG